MIESLASTGEMSRSRSQTGQLSCNQAVSQCSSDTFLSSIMGKKYSIGHKELELKPIIKSLFAEMLGTFMLVLVGCGAALNWITPLDITQVALKDRK